MVFTSYIFLVWFLPAVLVPHGLLVAAQRQWPAWHGWLRLQNAWLLAASYVFYAWAEPRLLGLLVGVTLVSYAAGWLLDVSRGTRWQTLVAVAALVVLLGVLGVFKYGDFIVGNLQVVSEALGGPAFRPLGLVLPVGISFFTFQAVSYCIDVKRGTTPRARSLLDYACYAAMFPHLIAGPIVRYATVAESLRSRRVSGARLASGVALFVLGFGKKVLLANPLGDVATVTFHAADPGWAAAWWGALAFGLQLYFDFSGYSDMAVGLGRLFGFEFLKNFATPYRGASVTEFWRRWHISLSTFLRDYLYLPLGGNRGGASRTYANLLIVMVLGGLWHGANWTFLAWGGWHGAWLALERWRGKRSLAARLPVPVQIASTLLVVLVGWVLFRAASLGEALDYLASMFGGGAGDPLVAPMVFGGGKPLLMLGAAVLAGQRIEAHDWCENLTWGKIVAIAVVGALGLLALAAQGSNPFLYYQF